MNKRWFGIVLFFIGGMVQSVRGLHIKVIHNNNSAGLSITMLSGGAQIDVKPHMSVEFDVQLEELAPDEGAEDKVAVTSGLIIKTFVQFAGNQRGQNRRKYVVVAHRSYYLFVCRWKPKGPASLMIVRENDPKDEYEIKLHENDTAVDLVIADQDVCHPLGVRLVEEGAFRRSKKSELCAKMMAHAPLPQYCNCVQCKKKNDQSIPVRRSTKVATRS